MAEPVETSRAPWWLAGALLAGAWLLHLATYAPTEPHFNNDETRHVMTGVFCRDALADGAWASPRTYAERYFLQYPALGLLSWPPFFYLVEGAFFTLTGASAAAAKVLIGLHVTLAAVYLLRLASRTHGAVRGAIAAGIFVLLPYVFAFSRHVMLEMPTLAYALGAIFHFHRHVEEHGGPGARRRDLWIAALLTAAACLTRFDGFFLLPVFCLILLGARRLPLLWQPRTLAAFGLFLALVVPYYALMAREIGWFHWQALSQGTSTHSAAPFSARSLTFYFELLPMQLGWPVLALALAGLATTAWSSRWRPAVPYLALILATYAMVSSVAELEERHGIYWLPAFAVLAVEGLGLAAALLRRPQYAGLLAGGLLGILGLLAADAPAPYVRGYREAARHVVERTTQSPYCLFDGLLNGDFVYQVRSLDAERRLWVLRGDKLLYSVLSDPHAGYVEHATSRDEILATLHRHDPEFIVVEEPQILFVLPAATLLREALREHPEEYALERIVPLESDRPPFAASRLLIYRKLRRNPDRTGVLELELPSLRRKVGTEAPGGTEEEPDRTSAPSLDFPPSGRR
jgi:hypothetical protein